MKRREFIAGFGGAVAWPLVARAQQSERARRVGVLMTSAETDSGPQARNLVTFRETLQKLGWTEGHNIRFDTRWEASSAASRRRFVMELVALRPDVILAHDTPATAALLQQTSTIPIVFALVADPIGSGFVASFPRPGRNVTGFVTIEGSLGGKWLELLKEIAPTIAKVAFLFNPTAAAYSDFYLTPFKTAGASLAVEAVAAPIRDPSELEPVFIGLAREPNSGVIVINDSFMDVHRADITSLATRYRLPAVYPYRLFAELGGLLSYGIDQPDNFRRAAFYVDRILKGDKPSDLPVQAPVKFEMVLNRKTANALGLRVPLSIELRADEVIE